MEEKRCSCCGNEIFSYDDYGRDLFEKDLRELFPNRRSWWVAVSSNIMDQEIGSDTCCRTLINRLMLDGGYKANEIVLGLWLDEDRLDLWRGFFSISPDFVVGVRGVDKN